MAGDGWGWLGMAGDGLRSSAKLGMGRVRRFQPARTRPPIVRPARRSHTLHTLKAYPRAMRPGSGVWTAATRVFDLRQPDSTGRGACVLRFRQLSSVSPPKRYETVVKPS